MRYFNLLLAMAMLVLVGCDGTEHSTPNETVIRSADPCNTWARPGWQTGPDALITPELRDGNASHLWPAEIIYYSVLENTFLGIPINPVLVLVYLENADLLSFGQEYGDFEMRLLKAVGYDLGSNKYNGFFINIVSSTYQWHAYQKRGLSFAEAQKGYPFISSTMSFKDAYAKYSKVMNDILGTAFSLHPDSRGYYQDFAGLVDANKIQLFLARVNSPLQDNLFNQPPVRNTVFDYSNQTPFCE